LQPYDDDLDAYRTLVVQQRKREREGLKAENRRQKTENKKEQARGETQHPRKEAAKIEKKIADLVARKDAMENEIAIACEKNDVHQPKVFKYLAARSCK